MSQINRAEKLSFFICKKKAAIYVINYSQIKKYYKTLLNT